MRRIRYLNQRLVVRVARHDAKVKFITRRLYGLPLPYRNPRHRVIYWIDTPQVTSNCEHAVVRLPYVAGIDTWGREGVIASCVGHAMNHDDGFFRASFLSPHKTRWLKYSAWAIVA